MVSKVALRVIKRAVAQRVGAGEDPEAVVASYDKLSKEQADEILATYKKS